MARDLRLFPRPPDSANRLWPAPDEGDNDPLRFITYLAAAFSAEVLALLQSSQPPPVEAVLIALLNDIAALETRTEDWIAGLQMAAVLSFAGVRTRPVYIIVTNNNR